MADSTTPAHGQEHVDAAHKAVGAVFGPNGWLDQAKQAQMKGVFTDFITKLFATLGPLIGPMILALIQSLLPVVTPPVTPPATPPTPSKPK